MGAVREKGEFAIPSEARNLALAQEGKRRFHAIPCPLFPVP
jgi:hypothetical protein